ncbi:hypothetical protein PM082_007112 [Marasmius tenuissimus]|nr:hypothetical protein PM082_007112 [Marasmius tenuissimus]
MCSFPFWRTAGTEPTLPSKTGTLHWTVARTGSNGIIIKVANAGGNAQTLAFVLPFNSVATSGTLQLLTGPQTGANNPSTPNAIAPRNSTITTGKTFNYQAPAYSLSVITFTAS